MATFEEHRKFDIENLLTEITDYIEHLSDRAERAEEMVERLLEAGDGIMKCDPEEWLDNCKIWLALVDERMLKALAEDNPSWATVSVTPKPFVASDLTKFVE